MVGVFVDTSALYALLDANDDRHPEAADIFNSLDKTTTDLVTHNYVLVEAIALVRRRLGPAVEARLINDLLPAIRVVWVDEATHRTALATYQSAGRTASLVDHVSFAVISDEAAELAFAFDGDFDDRGFRRPIRAADPGPRRLSETDSAYGEAATNESDLVSVAEVAARAGRSTNTIQSWRRRHPDFPRPVAQLASGPVWTWPAVSAWITSRMRPRRVPRTPGLLRGKIHLADDWDAPIPEIEAAFNS